MALSPDSPRPTTAGRPTRRRLARGARSAGMAAAAVLAAALSLSFWTGPGVARAEAETVSEPGTAASDGRCGRSLLPGLAASGRLAAMEKEAAAVPNGTGKFYTIEKPGLPPSFLFGTMHMTDPRVLAIGPAPTKALGNARRIVIETTDVLDQAKTYGAMLGRPDLMNLPAGKTLGDYMTPAVRAEAEAGLAELGIPFQSIETLQPWFFSAAMLLPACEVERAAAGATVLDVSLAETGKAASKPVVGIETAVEQLEAMASLSMTLQVDSLVATLNLKRRMPDVFETMIALYLDGRIGLITPVTESVMPLDAVSAASVKAYAEFEERIVVRRNNVMAERLAPFLKEGGNFIAVGALHLPGKEGLVELLRAEGYRLTRLD